MKTRLPSVIVAGLVILIVWYAAAFLLNLPQIEGMNARSHRVMSFLNLLFSSLNAPRPILPPPDRIIVEIIRTTLDQSPFSHRSLVFHSAVTAATAVTGLAIGALSGLCLAVLLVRSRTLEAGVMPLVIASQTVPVLAIAPMAVVILSLIGMTAFLSKVLITAYLCFFPVTVAMVRGLRSADRLTAELFRTYNASERTVLTKLNMPASMPFFFSGLKIAAGTAVVGAIVSELPTGGSIGLGARLLSGSYYGQTLQIWAALMASAVVSLLLIAGVSATERVVLSWRRE